MTQTIIEKVIDQAVRNLRSAGCQFAVITPDGRKLGELSVDQPKKVTRKRVNDFTVSGYMERVDAMQPGDVEIFKVGMYNAEQFRGAISARAFTKFGKGNATSTIVGDEVQLLRLA